MLYVHHLKKKNTFAPIFQQCVRASELTGILLAVFDDLHGGKIAYQYPVDILNQNRFRSVSHAIFPNPHFSSRLLSTELPSDLSDPLSNADYLICCLQRVEHERYPRNVFMFNFCFLLSPLDPPPDSVDFVERFASKSTPINHCRLEAYETIVYKLNTYFAQLELAWAELSKCIAASGSSKENDLPSLIADLYTGLTQKGTFRLDATDSRPPLSLFFNPTLSNTSCCFSNDDDRQSSDESPPSNHIPLHYRTPTSSSDTHVPVSADPIEPTRRNCSSHPVSTILSEIDGRKSLIDLTCLDHQQHQDNNVTRNQLRALVDDLRLIPYPNWLTSLTLEQDESCRSHTAGWLALPRLTRLLMDKQLGLACTQAAVRLRPEWSNCQSPISVVDLFKIYSTLCSSPIFNTALLLAHSHINFVELAEQKSVAIWPHAPPSTRRRCANASVSLLRLVQFGEVNGLIHRLACYPLCLFNQNKVFSALSGGGCDEISRLLHHLFTSTNPIDQSASICGRSPQSTASTNQWSGLNSQQVWNLVKSHLANGLNSAASIAAFLLSIAKQRSRSSQLPTLSRLTAYIQNRLVQEADKRQMVSANPSLVVVGSGDQPRRLLAIDEIGTDVDADDDQLEVEKKRTSSIVDPSANAGIYLLWR